MMGGERVEDGDDILDQLKALKGHVNSANGSIVERAIDEIANLRDRLTGSETALKTATDALNRMGSLVAVLQGRQKAADRLLD